MDHDAQETRLATVERFLDTAAPGWRDHPAVSRSTKNWPFKAELHVDEDQTRRDRRALGLDKGALSGEGEEAGEKTVEDLRREAVLRDLEEFKGVDGVAPFDGTERTDQLEGILATARARRAGGGMGVEQRIGEGRPGIDDSAAKTLKDGGAPGTGDLVGFADLPGGTPQPNTMPPAQAVALGAANASPETGQALQTEQDPARAARAADQQEAKAAGEAAGGIPAAAVQRP